MDLLAILFLAFGLSMDAFAVSVSAGISTPEAKFTHSLKVALCFGFFQAFMPYLGYLAASLFAKYILAFDHWVAFAVLSLIGGNMIFEALSSKESDNAYPKHTKFWGLIVLGFATSIDALAVGVNFALIPDFNVLSACLLIGIVTFIVSLIGVSFGKVFGSYLSKYAQITGGIILIGIGVKILADALWFAPM